MTKKEIEDIKSLLTGLAGISGFKSTHKRVDKAIAVLDRELSKLNQPAVSKCFEEKEFCDCGRTDKVVNFMICDAPTK